MTILVPGALLLLLALFLSRDRLRRMRDSLHEWKESDEQEEHDREAAEREVHGWTSPEGDSNETNQV